LIQRESTDEIDGQIQAGYFATGFADPTPPWIDRLLKEQGFVPRERVVAFSTIATLDFESSASAIPPLRQIFKSVCFSAVIPRFSS
jgi:hypothetical protein